MPTPRFRYFCIAMCIMFLASCDPFNTKINENSLAYFSAAKQNEVSLKDTLLVMTWNIKFGGARLDFYFDCHGDRSFMTEEEVLQNLEKIAEKINELDPDILFIQEIDVKSKRSAYINQVQWLLDHTDLNFAAYAPEWQGDFLIYSGIQRLNTGNAILAKWHVTDGELIELPQLSDQSKLEKYLYFKRNILKANLLLDNDQTVTLFSTQTSDYTIDDTKLQQLETIKAALDKSNDANQTFVIGATLNCIPPEAIKTSNFEDYACDSTDRFDDYSQQTSWMLPFYEYETAIRPTDKSDIFTFTSSKEGTWNRTLDYIFSNGVLISNSGIAHQNTMQLSDHAPITVLLKIRE